MTHLVIELEVRVHLEARVECLDGMPVTPVAVVQEPDTVPKTRVLQIKSAAEATATATAISGGSGAGCIYKHTPSIKNRPWANFGPRIILRRLQS